MADILGFGGFFFRAKDPKALALWYEQFFGIKPVPSDYGAVPWKQKAGITVFAPFPADSDFFGDAEHDWMLNFRVADLDKSVQELREGGVHVTLDPQIYPNGRFASLKDPEGNPIQLWQEMRVAG